MSDTLKKKMETVIHGYTEADLMKLHPSSLRSILRERTHHTIEVMIYRILDGKMNKPPVLGLQAKKVLDIWRKRGLPVNSPDIQWCIRYVEIADKLNAGHTVSLGTELPAPFSDTEMRTVKKLLYERRSIRQFTDKPVPEDMLNQIVQAGVMAPQGCNVGSTRFIVMRDPKQWKLVRSDIPIENGVMIVICTDMLVYNPEGIDERGWSPARFPHNIYFDAAAAADHMCLMAHALGLGACWLTHGEETQKKIREYFDLPETFTSRCHIIVGWPDEAPIKSGRSSIEDTIIEKGE